MKRLVVWIGMVLLVPSLVWAGEANAKIGKLVERMRVGPLKRLDIGVTRTGTSIPALVTDEDLVLGTTKIRVLLVNVGGAAKPEVSVGSTPMETR